MTQLARRLGLFDATMIEMGGIIGSGIFIKPYLVAQQLIHARISKHRIRTETPPSARPGQPQQLRIRRRFGRLARRKNHGEWLSRLTISQVSDTMLSPDNANGPVAMSRASLLRITCWSRTPSVRLRSSGVYYIVRLIIVWRRGSNAL